MDRNENETRGHRSKLVSTRDKCALLSRVRSFREKRRVCVHYFIGHRWSMNFHAKLNSRQSKV